MAEPTTGPDGRPGTLADGFNVVAKDLDRAFALALSPNEAVVMLAVREQSWSASLVTRRPGEARPDPIPARLNLSALAKSTGCNRSRLSTALRGLITGQILLESEAGLLVNKHYARWRTADGTSLRFGKDQLNFIRAAKRKRKQATDPSDTSPAPPSDDSQRVLQTATGCCELQQSGVLPNATGVLPIATVTVADCNTPCCGLQQSHIEEHARDLDSQKIERPSEHTPSVCVKSADHTHTPGPETPGSTPQRSEEDYADVRLAASILAGDLRTTHLGSELLRQHNLPGLIVLEGWRWVLAANAILGPSVEDRKRRSFPYLVGIARGYDPADRAPTPAPATNGHLPAPAAPRSESPSERRRRELRESLNAFKVPSPTEGEAHDR